MWTSALLRDGFTRTERGWHVKNIAEGMEYSQFRGVDANGWSKEWDWVTPVRTRWNHEPLQLKWNAKERKKKGEIASFQNYSNSVVLITEWAAPSLRRLGDRGTSEGVESDWVLEIQTIQQSDWRMWYRESSRPCSFHRSACVVDRTCSCITRRELPISLWKMYCESVEYHL